MSTSSSQSKRPKGILKKPSSSSTSSTAVAQTPAPAAAAVSPYPIEETHPDPRQNPSVREAVIQQALIIQQQRELEDQIQDAIIELSRFPLSSSSSSVPSPDQLQSYDITNPPPATLSAFRRLLAPFQPGDYEDLIEERNTRGLCGYVLCPSPRVKLSGGGEYKLVNYGRPDFGIVPRRELERWCSRICARRAMYIKVQLLETGAWERVGADGEVGIELLNESQSKPNPTNTRGEDDGAAKRLAKELQSLEVDKQKKTTRDAMDLALERGDRKGDGSKITVTIREKKVMMAAQEPSLDEDGEDHLILDGYKTKFDPRSKATDKSSQVTEVATENQATE
ncbi:hypothetical protein F4677DRAFT_40167 [Hypoxylon crocopeplum]|nr:hypothetical protein F4677DRAFT_40167 [Hypoxylon crocopeplum]